MIKETQNKRSTSINTYARKKKMNTRELNDGAAGALDISPNATKLALSGNGAHSTNARGVNALARSLVIVLPHHREAIDG